MQGSKAANSLRKRMTHAEKLLWYRLRNRRLDNYKFRRQVPIGPYIADFLCMSVRLIVEVDGGQHMLRAAQDHDRTLELENEGYRVVRFWNNDILENMDGVLETLTLALSLRERELNLAHNSFSLSRPRG